MKIKSPKLKLSNPNDLLNQIHTLRKRTEMNLKCCLVANFN